MGAAARGSGLVTDAAAVEIARLRARVEALEAALQRRSRELQSIQENVCPRDLMIISRVAAGLSPVPRGCFDPTFWDETTDIVEADVEEALVGLWKSLSPSADNGR